MEKERRKKILVVDDDPAQLALHKHMLRNSDADILTATNGREALDIVLRDEPRIVVTDWLMPEMDGLELCKALRSHEGIRFVYVIIATANLGADKVVEAFDAGADDFVAKPVNENELLARLWAAERIVAAESTLAKRTRELHRVNAEMAMAHQKLNVANEKLKRMATTDELTGLLNRREAFERLNDFAQASRRYGHELAAIMLDIDHFKQFNDTYGHAAGDYVLRETARVLRGRTRTSDKVARVGGEEFLLICPGINGENAMRCAENVRAAIEHATFEYEGVNLNVTVSLGVAAWNRSYSKPDEMLKDADEALYVSKRSGRNQATLAKQSCEKTPQAEDKSADADPTQPSAALAEKKATATP